MTHVLTGQPLHCIYCKSIYSLDMNKKCDVEHKFKVYTRDDIQQVYKQHHYNCGTVLYSEDGYDWHSVPIDSGKWNISKWVYAFIRI